MKFNSQICTSKSQSERLLALGLKKNTADCYYYAQQRWTGNSYENTGELFLSPLWDINDKGHFQYLNEVFADEIGEKDTPYVLPAWSLHRLLEMIPITVPDKSGITHSFTINGASDISYYFFGEEDWEVWKNWSKKELYDNVIDCIEWLIKEGHFNKEYLEKQV